LKKPYVAVVDDDSAFANYLRTFLSLRGYDTRSYSRGDEIVATIKQGDPPDIVLLDVMMPGMNGLDTLRALKSAKPDLQVIMLSGREQASTIVEAVRLGAADYVVKPDDPEGLGEIALDAAIKSAIEKTRLVSEITELRRQLSDDQDRAFLFWGDSPDMSAIATVIEQVSDSDVTVLIRGESGVGKELVARALHEQSLRKDKPFVKVNCAALPTELLESELFGFEKGAFTGAIQHKPGKFEFANHGTMFLDEIGDMSFPLQAKLLQALQDGEFSRLGGKADVRVDVRVITATNCDLESAVAAGKFREDLYFRLNVVTITIPPLRERREEIPMLTDHFVKKYSVQYNKPFGGITPELARLFLEYEWPGNVRQLENMIKRMVVLGSETAIIHELTQPSSPLHHWPHTTSSSTPRPTALPLQPVMPPPAAAAAPVAVAGAGPAAIGINSVAAVAAAAGAAGNVSLKDIARTAAREAERELILRMLTRTRWNRKEAAEILGISYKALLYKIKENGLDKAS